MPLSRSKVTPSPTTTTDDLHGKIAEHVAIAVRFELHARKGLAKGRYSRTGIEYVIDDDEGRDTASVDPIFHAILEAAESVEAKHGCSCRFAVVPVVLPPGETERRLPAIPFVLDDQADDDGGLSDTVREVGNLTKSLTGTCARLVGLVERQATTVAKMTDAAASRETASAEHVRIKLEHERWKVEQQAEGETAEAEFDMIENLLGKAIIVMGSREAAKNTGDPKQPVWEYARDKAGEILSRPEVRDALGDDGVSIIEAVSVATDQATCEAAFGRLIQLIRAGSIDGDALLAAAPELMPLARFWA